MKRRDITPEEQSLWERVTSNDTVLPQEVKAYHMPVTKISKPVYRTPDTQHYFLPEVAGEPLSVGAYAGIDRNTAGRFRKGEFTIDATLDLHGMTRERAQMKLMDFVRVGYERGNRCLLVITGKGQKNTEHGKGVLRELAPRWLDAPGIKPMILAIDTAQPEHGGSGAYYVLLRRRRHE